MPARDPGACRSGMMVHMEVAATGEMLAAVGAALGGHVTELTNLRRTPLDYDAFLAHRTVTRVHGDAIVDGERVPWSLIEKHTDGPDLASPYLLDNGMRELKAYRSRLFDDMPPGIRAPRDYGTQLGPDGQIVLWLEEVHHKGSRPLDEDALLTVARHLGEMNGRWFGQEPVDSWLFTGWIDRHAQPEAVEQGLATLRRGHPNVVARLGNRVAATEQLILAQPRISDVLQSLPQTLCHHDAVGANVFRTDSATVLVDWESVGPGTVGADLASLLFSSVRRGDASARDMTSVLEDAVRSFTDGFRAEAPGVKADDVRRGFDAAIALRWKLAVDVAAGLESGEAPRRGSLPDEAAESAVEELILLVDVLLASAARVLQV